MKGIYLNYNTPVKSGEKLKITLRIKNDYGFASDVRVLFNRYGQKPGEEANFELSFKEDLSDKNYSTFCGEIALNSLGYHTFYISLKINGIQKSIFYSSQEDGPVLVSDIQSNLEFWKCFSYLKTFTTPDWVKGGIMYQIFVDTFYCKDPPESMKSKLVSWDTFPKWKPDSDGVYRNDQYYGGNIKGIIEKLPYIKSLGVNVIYLTPIFKGSSSNRYDTIDYESIDEMVGTWEELAELKRKANDMGIKIVLDVVFNHASSESPLIKEYPGLFTNGFWWGYETLVEFNKNNPKYYELLEKWLTNISKFVDGLRFDVADELPDFVLRFIRATAKKLNILIYLLGEVWKNAVTGDFRSFLYGDELDGVMNYQFANAIYRMVRWKNFKYFKGIIKDIKMLYPPEALDVSPIFLSSHDIPRIPNILVGDFMKEDPRFENAWNMEQDGFWYTNGKFDTYKFRLWEFENDKFSREIFKLAKRYQKVAIFMQYTFPGLPSIFAGDEIGMTGYKDPFNRKPFDWNNIDYDIYNFYVKLGAFRKAFKEIFSDSKRFVIYGKDGLKYDFETCTLTYSWKGNNGDLKCIVNLKDLKCAVYRNEKMEFVVN